MTNQIVFLFETLEDILINNTKGGKIDGLTYKASNEELNELHLTFNNVAKAMSIAHGTVKEGEEPQALLNYSEAYHIFRKHKNMRHMGVCLSNIGSLRLQMKEYNWA